MRFVKGYQYGTKMTFLFEQMNIGLGVYFDSETRNTFSKFCKMVMIIVIGS